MEPWDIAEQLRAATNQGQILKDLTPDDPFWIGASYAVDPFVGIIYKLPLADPRRYERGLLPEMFDRVARLILAGELSGARLAAAVEALSRGCTQEQWKLWYRPILEGKMDLRLPLAVFNKHAPVAILPPALSKPKPLTTAATHTPTSEYIIQPAYDNRCMWFVDSRTALIEVRGYDSDFRQIHDPNIDTTFRELGKKKPMDVVIFGYLNQGLVVDDLMRREHFTSESCLFPLRQRLDIADKLGLPMAQQSDVLRPGMMSEFMQELGMVYEQKYAAALIRDLDGMYPFREQTDLKLSAKYWIKEIEEWRSTLN